MGRCGAVLYAFDLLTFDGRDLRPERLDLRRDLLAEIVADPQAGMDLQIEELRTGLGNDQTCQNVSMLDQGLATP
jgi:ATP-dependent DNA ligase